MTGFGDHLNKALEREREVYSILPSEKLQVLSQVSQRGWKP